MAVDWDCVVEHNREALRRILAMMVTMVAAGAAAVAGEAARPTLPRHLYRAVLAILHPAESAARRLIVVAARGLVVPKPRLKPCVPKPRRRPSPTVIVFPHAARFAPPPPRAVPARIPLPLFDTLRPPARRLRSVPARCAPRIAVPGLTVLHRLPPKPTPFDPIDATRLNLRLATLAAVLDDLPKEALRFARWRARSDARLGALRGQGPRQPANARPPSRRQVTPQVAPAAIPQVAPAAVTPASRSSARSSASAACRRCAPAARRARAAGTGARCTRSSPTCSISPWKCWNPTRRDGRPGATSAIRRLRHALQGHDRVCRRGRVLAGFPSPSRGGWTIAAGDWTGGVAGDVRGAVSNVGARPPRPHPRPVAPSPRGGGKKAPPSPRGTP